MNTGEHDTNKKNTNQGCNKNKEDRTDKAEGATNKKNASTDMTGKKISMIEESEYQEEGCNTRIQKGRRMHELHI